MPTAAKRVRMPPAAPLIAAASMPRMQICNLCIVVYGGLWTGAPRAAKLGWSPQTRLRWLMLPAHKASLKRLMRSRPRHGCEKHGKSEQEADCFGYRSDRCGGVCCGAAFAELQPGAPGVWNRVGRRVWISLSEPR